MCCFFFCPQKFTDFEEVPKISTENDLDDCFDDDILFGSGDEHPPPIPPRLGSLNLKKPLPIIPSSESFNDFTNANANNVISSSFNTTKSSLSINASAIKDATNNLINNELSASDHHQQQQQQSQPTDSILNSSLSSRPLPPIPGNNSLDKVSESGSEYSSSDEYELEDDKHEDDDECSEMNGKAENNNGISNGNTADDSNLLNGLNGNTSPLNEDSDLKTFAEG